MSVELLESTNPNFPATSLKSAVFSLPEEPANLWSIVLAGGNGERISAFTNSWAGRPIPKQYCAFVGTRSMLQHTLARADALVPRERQLTVIAKSHLSEARSQLADRAPKTVILQPANCDTLPGVFLPLTYVYAADPYATTVIYPSDHFIYPDQDFLKIVRNAIQATEELQHGIVLLGVPAYDLGLEYGWLCTGRESWNLSGHSVRTVNRFVEKPCHADAVKLRASGAMWNTLILVAKVHTLWRLGWMFYPEMMRLFELLYDSIGTSHESAVLDAIYACMPRGNFSADFLTAASATNSVGVMSMEGILWSDWGRVERIAETLARIGKEPSFPMMLIADKTTTRARAVGHGR
jgi:mannose-1-phosphate guanylyltransferase